MSDSVRHIRTLAFWGCLFALLFSCDSKKKSEGGAKKADAAAKKGEGDGSNVANPCLALQGDDDFGEDVPEDDFGGGDFGGTDDPGSGAPDSSDPGGLGDPTTPGIGQDDDDVDDDDDQPADAGGALPPDPQTEDCASPLPTTDGGTETPGGTSAGTTTGGSGGGTGGGGGGYDPGPGIEGCESQGKAWIAVSGGVGVCGPSLVTDWCCTQSEVKARFPKFADAIQERFDGQGAGKKLYHCSKEGNNYQFHMAGPKDGGGATYYVVKLSGVTATDTGRDGSSCPKLTMDDLGITLGRSDGGNGGGFGGDDADGGFGNDDDAQDDDDRDGSSIRIPDNIPGLDSLTEAGLRSFVNGGEYEQWTKNRNIRDGRRVNGVDSPHGRVRSYYNDRLEDSLADGNNEHPVGSVVVKEIYDDEDDLIGHALSAKIARGRSADTWLFWKFVQKDGVDHFGNGINPCADCHTKGTDFVFEGP